MAVKRVYRSDDEAVAGVCAGIAEYLGIDTAAVRILALLSLFSTVGLSAIVYGVLWLVLPASGDVGPETLATNAYAHGAHATGGLSGEPPLSTRARLTDDYDIPRICVWFGVVLLAIAAAGIFASLLPTMSWWQFLPVVICMAGFAFMITPAHVSTRLVRFSFGFTLLFLGLFVLTITMGVVSVPQVMVAAGKLWPGAMVAFGLVLIGMALEEDLFYLAAAVCIGLLLVTAVIAYGQPAGLEASPVLMDMLAPTPSVGV